MINPKVTAIKIIFLLQEWSDRTLSGILILDITLKFYLFDTPEEVVQTVKTFE